MMLTHIRQMELDTLVEQGARGMLRAWTGLATGGALIGQ
jgi:hypothetical protein